MFPVFNLYLIAFIVNLGQEINIISIFINEIVKLSKKLMKNFEKLARSV